MTLRFCCVISIVYGFNIFHENVFTYSLCDGTRKIMTREREGQAEGTEGSRQEGEAFHSSLGPHYSHLVKKKKNKKPWKPLHDHDLGLSMTRALALLPAAASGRGTQEEEDSNYLT